MGPPGSKALVDEALLGKSPIAKAPATSAPACLLLLLCLCMCAALIFLWYLAWHEWAWEDPRCPPCSLGNIQFYWAFSPVDYCEGDFLLSCLTEAMILYNNSVSLSKNLMIGVF